MKRDSFVLFTEDLAILDALSDEQTAKLFKAIREYAKGDEPDLSDPVIKVAFLPIKLHLDKCNEKWLETKEVRSKAGTLGAQARWGKKEDMAKMANATNAMAKMANDSKPCQGIAKMPVDVDVYVDEDVNVNVDEKINYQQIADMYNDTCVSFPRLTKLSDNRKKAIRARLRKYSLDEIKKVFELAEQSDFLKGNNNRNWSANFDWLVNDNNMAKVLDGNYSNKIHGSPPRGSTDFSKFV